MKRNNFVLFVSIVLYIGVVAVAPARLTPQWTLSAILIASAALTLVIGKLIFDSWWGVLITPQYTMSLSRTQTVVWTILICGSFMAVAFERLAAGADALAFTIPDTLLGLIGISLTSAVATSAVLSGKSAKPATQAQVDLAEQKNETEVEACGTLFGYKDKSKACLMDMFEGDELGDAHTIDLGKVQMFFFTIVGAVVYLGEMYSQLGAVPTSLPDLPTNLVYLMGMSHAGYVGNKLVNRTPDATVTQSAAATATVNKSAPAMAGDQPKIEIAATQS
jgi:hypothetical protein